MRALAREMHVPPMTIYNYVPSREVLRGLVVDHVLGKISIPTPELGTWEERLHTLLSDARRVFVAHPGVLSELGDKGSAETSRLAQAVLTILRDGGFSDDDAVLCFATLFTFMTGQIDLDSMTVAMASGTAHATLEGVTESTQFSRDELFEFGFDTIIEGLKSKLLRN
jgi:AcrR family transcriptional regulator